MTVISLNRWLGAVLDLAPKTGLTLVETEVQIALALLADTFLDPPILMIWRGCAQLKNQARSTNDIDFLEYVAWRRP